MFNFKLSSGLLASLLLLFVGCTDSGDITSPVNNLNKGLNDSSPNTETLSKGVITANGWYDGNEIYYIDRGPEKGVTQRGDNQIYLIGDNRLHQANVVLFVPGESGYTPHWNVNIVHTTTGVTVSEILSSPYASSHFNDDGVLFDSAEDILGAEQANLVVLERPGIVVLCPIVSKQAADAPGNMPRSEDFAPFDLTTGF